MQSFLKLPYLLPLFSCQNCFDSKKFKHLVSGGRLLVLLAVLQLTPAAALAECSFRSFSGSEDNVIGAYISYYGRPADPGGLAYWSERLAKEGSLNSIIQVFGESEEFEKRFGSLSNAELVSNMYIQLFGRTPEAEGLDFYVRNIEDGTITLQSASLNILFGAQNKDAIIVNNRKNVTKYYISQLEALDALDLEPSAETLAALIAGVTVDIETANSACDAIDELLASVPQYTNLVDTILSPNEEITIITTLGDTTIRTISDEPIAIKVDDVLADNGDKAIHIEVTGKSATIELPRIPEITFPSNKPASLQLLALPDINTYPIQYNAWWKEAWFLSAFVGLGLDRIIQARLYGNIINHTEDKLNKGWTKYNAEKRQASRLMSVCEGNTSNNENIYSDCPHKHKVPVLLIHGFQAEILNKGFAVNLDKNGGVEYWGKFPNRLLNDGYLPFEFRWGSNARFEDVAVDLAEAIGQVYLATGKRVHIVAHSFGGILLRSLLQAEPNKIIELKDKTADKEIQDMIATLTTVGSPHSGIADEVKTMHGVAFPEGQDSDGLDFFRFCQQLSCQLMGEDVIGETIGNIFKVNDEAGEWAAKLYNTRNNLPAANLQILIGFALTYKPDSFSTPYDFRVAHGDLLISGHGQRFSPALPGKNSWSNLLAEAKFGNAIVSEFILGRRSVKDERNLAIQKLKPFLKLASAGLNVDASLDYYFTPFRHSGGSESKIRFVSEWYSQEVGIGSDKEGKGGYNDTYQRVKDWMVTKLDCSMWGESTLETVDGIKYCSAMSTSKLNDTGITWGGNYPEGNNDTCTGTTISEQDCSHGRDATHNDDSDGHAGFSFTKLDENGNDLLASANQWSCVRDNVTGLIWEVKTNSGGLHDKGNSYSWYEPDNSKNGGNAGTQNGGNCIGSSCDTYRYVQAVNVQGLCGSYSWRMPDVDELSGLAALDRTDPAIDSTYFPNSGSTWFWSSSPGAGYGYVAWVVGLYYGYDNWVNKVNKVNKVSNGSVRLVRSGQ